MGVMENCVKKSDRKGRSGCFMFLPSCKWFWNGYWIKMQTLRLYHYLNYHYFKGSQKRKWHASCCSGSEISVRIFIRRYYCRKYITRGFHNNYSIVELDGFTSLQVSEYLGEFTLPVMFMEAMNCTSRPLTMLVHTLKALRKELDEIKAQVADNLKELNSLIAEKVDGIYYDLAQQSVCLLEEVKPHFIAHKLDHCDTGLYVVECCVSDGEVIPWVISDINYWTDRPHCKKSVTIPTTMGVSTQFEVWAVIREILEKLMSFGFKDSIVNITIQVNHDGSVRIHDIFPGFVYDNVPLNRFVYQNGDTLKAHCDIGAGQEPSHVKARPRHVAMKGYITLFGSGVLSDLVDLEKLKSNKHVTFSVPNHVRLQILNSRPKSGFSASDPNRTPRSRSSSLSSLDYNHSRLTTPQTSRSRMSTPDTSLAPIAEMNPSTTNDEPSTSGDTAYESAKSESDASDEKPSEAIMSSPNSLNGKETESTRYSNLPTPVDIVASFTPTRSEKSPMSKAVTENITPTEYTPVPALVLESDRDSRDEDEELGDPRPVIVADSDTGVCIGQIYVFGSSTEDCTKQLTDFLQTVVKKKEHCPWLGHQYLVTLPPQTAR